MTGSRLTLHPTVLVAFVLGLMISTFGVPAHAADSTPAARAARLTYLQGTVMVNEAGGSSSVPAQLNLPLLSGVQIVTAQDGQAEIEFEDGSVVRLTPNSAFSLDNLAVDPTGVFTTNLSLIHGLAYAELRATPQYRYWINAGGDVVSPVENATVRVNFDQPPAIFSVLDGTAHVERPNGSAYAAFQADVRAGESLSIDANQANYSLTQGINPDSWDQWNEDLDQSAAAQAANTTDVRNNYAGPEGYGWSDLDANGSWYDVPGQGPVWQPQLAVDDSGFDPYGYGSWVQYPGVGYVWASGYSWGWTPYRCGNWSYFGGFGWGWAPGAGCGALGWGFVGAGLPVNITVFPKGYRPIRVPAPGHGPERPLVQVHTFVPSRPSPGFRPIPPGQRQIAGVMVRPIAPAHINPNPDGLGAGSSLRRDYPVDSKTRTPVLGLAGTRPAAVSSPAGSQPNRPARGNSPATPTSRLAPATSYSEPSRPAAATPATQPAPEGPRPTPPSAPAPRSAPQPQQSPAHPTYSPPASQPTPPRNTPPPSQPRYTPPSSPAPSQPSQPRYTPPPSPPSAPRYTPPPSPPPAAPSHPSYSPPPSPPPSPSPAPSAPSHSSPK